MLASDGRAGPADGRAPSTAVYLYGVVRAGSIGEIASEAVFGGRVELVEASVLAALTSTVPEEEIRVRRRDLRRHLDVLEEAFAETTVLPCRFGTAVATVDDVRTFLTDRAGELVNGLERLDGCAQFNLKVTYDEDELFGGIVSRDSDIAALREATRDEGVRADAARIQLGQLVAAAVDAERERDATAILDEVRPHVIELAESEAGAAEAVKASLLVRKDDATRLESELEALAEREHPRLRFELIGPVPPTAFAAAAVEA
jgi:hypothetical protein